MAMEGKGEARSMRRAPLSRWRVTEVLWRSGVEREAALRWDE